MCADSVQPYCSGVLHWSFTRPTRAGSGSAPGMHGAKIDLSAPRLLGVQTQRQWAVYATLYTSGLLYMCCARWPAGNVIGFGRSGDVKVEREK